MLGSSHDGAAAGSVGAIGREAQAATRFDDGTGLADSLPIAITEARYTPTNGDPDETHMSWAVSGGTGGVSIRSRSGRLCYGQVPATGAVRTWCDNGAPANSADRAVTGPPADPGGGGGGSATPASCGDAGAGDVVGPVRYLDRHAGADPIAQLYEANGDGTSVLAAEGLVNTTPTKLSPRWDAVTNEACTLSVPTTDPDGRAIDLANAGLRETRTADAHLFGAVSLSEDDYGQIGVVDAMAGTFTSIAGFAATGDADRYVSAISPNGRYVVIHEDNGDVTFRVYDRQTHAVTATEQVAVTGRSVVAVYDDGAYLVTANGTPAQILRHSGGRDTVVSATTAGDPGQADAALWDSTADGRYVLFSSAAANLDPAGSGTVATLFVKDTTTGVLEVVTRDGVGVTPGDFINARISVNGRYVVWSPFNSYVFPTDGARYGTFAADRIAGTVRLADVLADGSTRALAGTITDGTEGVLDDGRVLLYGYGPGWSWSDSAMYTPQSPMLN